MVEVSAIKSWTDPVRGNVTEVTDARGNVLWSANTDMYTVKIGSMSTKVEYASVEINGVVYGSVLMVGQTIQVPRGTVAICKVKPPNGGTSASIKLNGQQVMGGNGSYTYNFEIKGNVTISIETKTLTSAIVITEEKPTV